ncbi:MAG TPA: flavodoxin [Herpetosiphonaceae bacterium]|nr:flavodoxin [Herpetosiphonaceae bacterium]
MFRFDETDPRLLLIHTGNEEAEASDFAAVARHWTARIAAGQPFGVVMVSEPHEHHHDEDHGREQEAVITAIINDFRRDQRERNNQLCHGYVNVISPELVREHAPDNPGAWEAHRAGTERFAAYAFGVRGHVVASLAEATAWLDEQASLPPLPLDDLGADGAGAPAQVGLFYGSTTGVTKYIAEQIAREWNAAGLPPVALVNIVKVKHLADLLAFDHLILGIPTWNIGQLQDDWETRFHQLDQLDFSGTRVALFGIGDQVNYAENFQDALGMLASRLGERGAILAGQWPGDDYEFAASLALRDGRLAGLAIDEVNQPELTAERIAGWVAQVAAEWQLAPAAVQA